MALLLVPSKGNVPDGFRPESSNKLGRVNSTPQQTSQVIENKRRKLNLSLTNLSASSKDFKTL